MSTATAYVLRFVSFGAAHWFGLPGGPAGAALAGVFSCALFWLSRRYGLLHAIAVHLVVDIAIFAAASPFLLFTGWYVGV